MSVALRDLSYLLHPAHYRKRWLAMIKVYIDDTGTDAGRPIIGMAGFLSSLKRWGKFETEWDRILNPSDEIKPSDKKRVFHATDCLGKDGHGDFEEWLKADRNALVDRLIPIAKKRTIFGFGCAFGVRDYEEIVPKWIKKKWEHPYYLCFFHIAQVLAIHREKFSFRNEKIGVVVAHKPKYIGLITSLYDQVQRNEAAASILGKMTPYGKPEEDIPIQAADLICYLIRTFWEKEYVSAGSAHPRTKQMLEALLAPQAGADYNFLEPHFLTREFLERFVQAYEETQRKVGDWEWNPKKITTLR
jgi:hypothetical protein